MPVLPLNDILTEPMPRADLWPGAVSLDEVAKAALVALPQTRKAVGGWCGSLSTHPPHADCTGVESVPGTTSVIIPGYEPQLEDDRCVGAEPATEPRTQDELLTALDELLDNALHDDRCYIHENDTECVCIIGVIRAVLPPCGAVKITPTGVPAWAKGAKAWKCLRTAHPASPERHYFSED
jgi:hypothetical protein